jgi:quaternary ammonium compound-resistance protein SugE
VTSAWTYLIAAGLFEIGWPLGLKWAQQARDLPGTVTGIVVAIVAMGVSGDPNSLGRWLGAALIIAGVATLKLAH